MTDDHFLALSESEGFLAACTSADGYDVYEMRIAFSAFSTEFAGAPFQAELGAVFGLDFNAGLTDVGIGYDGENGVYRGDYVSLGGFSPITAGRTRAPAHVCGWLKRPMRTNRFPRRLPRVTTAMYYMSCLRSLPSARRWPYGLRARARTPSSMMTMTMMRQRNV